MVQIDHINIVVTDMDRSIEFYTKALDFELRKRAKLTGEWIDSIVGLSDVEGEVAYLYPPKGGGRIELLQYVNPVGEALVLNQQANTRGLRHIAFEVDRLDVYIERVMKYGGHVPRLIVEIPEKVVKHEQGRKSVLYFYDPDGVLLELACYTK